jgi:hypothetical protein
MGGGLLLLIFLPGLASNLDPPNLSLPSSLDYRCEPFAPSFLISFFVVVLNL